MASLQDLLDVVDNHESALATRMGILGRLKDRIGLLHRAYICGCGSDTRIAWLTYCRRPCWVLGLQVSTHPHVELVSA